MSNEYLDKYIQLDWYMHGKLRSTSISGQALATLYELQKHEVYELFNMDLEGYYKRGAVSDAVYNELKSYMDFVNDASEELDREHGNLLSAKGTVAEKLATIPDDIFVYLGSKSGWIIVQTCGELKKIMPALNAEYKAKPVAVPKPRMLKDGSMSIPDPPEPWVDFPDRHLLDVYIISALQPNGVAIKMTGSELGNPEYSLGGEAESKPGPKSKSKKKYSSSQTEMERNKKIEKEWEEATNTILSYQPKQPVNPDTPKREKIVISYNRRRK